MSKDIELRPLSMDIREQMTHIKLQQGIYTNTGSFVICYLWKDALKIEVHLETDMYAIKEWCNPADVWAFPVGSYEAKKNFITQLVNTYPNLTFLKVRDTDKCFLEEHFPNMFCIYENPDDDEYIYDVAEYEALAGKKWRKFREAENRLRVQHTLAVESIDANNLHTVKFVMDEWAKGRSPGGYQNTLGNEVDDMIIQSYQSLGLMGVLLRIDGNPTAVVIGYPLSDTICDMTVMKYVGDFKDICRIALRAFMLHFKNQFRYFNFEEDGGIEGLRTIKKRLNPCRIEKMWKAELKTQRR